jgi:hypothetical protein
MGETWEPSNKATLFQILRSVGQKGGFTLKVRPTER